MGNATEPHRRGVDDLYTDPQIHTASESTANPRGMGRGNMGLRGMALFFASHRSSVQGLVCYPYRGG